MGVPASFAWSTLADYTSGHRVLMLGLFVVGGAVRWLILVVPVRLWPMMAVVVVADCLRNPVTAFADAAVMAGCCQVGFQK